MKTFVMKVVALNPAIKGGLIRLTENRTGNCQIEGDCLQHYTDNIKAALMAGIDAVLCGYDDPMKQQQDIYVVAV